MQVSKNQIESARNANLAEFFISNGYETEQHGAELHVKGLMRELSVITTENLLQKM